MLSFKPTIRGIPIHKFCLLLNLHISTHQHQQIWQIWPLLPKFAIIDKGSIRRDWSSFHYNFFFWRKSVRWFLNNNLISLPLFSLWCCWKPKNPSNVPNHSPCWFSKESGFFKGWCCQQLCGYSTQNMFVDKTILELRRTYKTFQLCVL